MTKKSIVRPAVIYILFFFFFFDNFLDESATQSCRVSLSLQINRFFFFILAELCPAASTEVNLVNLRLSPFHHGESNGVTPLLAVWEETSSLLGLNLCNFSWVGKNKTLCCPSGLPFIVIFFPIIYEVNALAWESTSLIFSCLSCWIMFESISFNKHTRRRK